MTGMDYLLSGINTPASEIKPCRLRANFDKPSFNDICVAGRNAKDHCAHLGINSIEPHDDYEEKTDGNISTAFEPQLSEALNLRAAGNLDPPKTDPGNCPAMAQPPVHWSYLPQPER